MIKLNKKDGAAPAVADANWEKKTRMEYDSLVKQKKMEIQNFSKQQIKESVRIGYQELCEIHDKFGFSNECLAMLKRAYGEAHDKTD